jgi:hypothetical protein
MYNDSIETLLLRHYGSNSPTPDTLKQRITASVRQQADEMRQSQQITTRLREQRISRRRVIRLVAGLGVLGTGITSAQILLSNQDGTQPAYS